MVINKTDSVPRIEAVSHLCMVLAWLEIADVEFMTKHGSDLTDFLHIVSVVIVYTFLSIKVPRGHNGTAILIFTRNRKSNCIYSNIHSLLNIISIKYVYATLLLKFL